MTNPYKEGLSGKSGEQEPEWKKEMELGHIIEDGEIIWTYIGKYNY